MNQFRTTNQILNFETRHPLDISKEKLLDWDYSIVPKMSDIKIWEEIYYSLGGVSVYAAYNPYVEYYIIVHDLFKNKTQVGIEEFYGINASEKVKDRLKEFDIFLPSSTTWVNVVKMPTDD